MAAALRKHQTKLTPPARDLTVNEGQKTGIFCGVAAVTLLIATFIAWPASNDESDIITLDGGGIVGEPLFNKFKDPLTAASMKLVTFDEAQGTLSNFEVRKDAETGDWIIPSREGYPADAVEQMKNAANSLVDLKVLDVVPANVEDHGSMGVKEPKLDDLSVGDEGVGRLVTFKNEEQKTIASLIIGDKIKDTEQIYVRKPGQDPVYAVALDDTPLTTNFQDWIEDDLLKLSSIEVEDMQFKDYNAQLGQGGRISIAKNFEADLEKETTDWKLAELREFEPGRPMADPKVVAIAEDQKLNGDKIKEVESALDDLKIANVLRKPDGMSANLKASKDFMSDQKAVESLAQRGFYPVPIGANGETEILSANGELIVGLKGGVEYVLRFGNISGLTKKEDTKEGDSEEASSGGVNRYLLVTTRVNEAKVPVPELKPVPATIEELEAMQAKANPPEGKPAAEVEEKPAAEVQEDAGEPKEEMKAEEGDDAPTDEGPDNDKADEEKAAKEKADEDMPAEKQSDGEKPDEGKSEKKEDAPLEEKPAEEANAEKAEEVTSEESAEESPAEESGETEAEGKGSASETGQAFGPADDDDKEEADAEDKAKDDDAKEEEAADSDAKPADSDAKPADSDDVKPADAKPSDDAPAGDAEETEEEKQERLEAAQEKITKENQRKLDERKDQLDKAKEKVKELNARFADWYYVIPESTYSKLKIERDALFKQDIGESPIGMPSGGPGAAPGTFPGGFPGLPPGVGN